MSTPSAKKYWEKPINLRLTAHQRKVLSEIVDGALDAGACKDGLRPDENRALSSIFDRLIGRRIDNSAEKARLRALRKEGCTCENPEPDDGVAGVANDCPIHG